MLKRAYAVFFSFCNCFTCSCTNIFWYAVNCSQGAVKIMAKDLIRTRHQITKFYALKSQLQGVSLRIQVAIHLYMITNLVDLIFHSELHCTVMMFLLFMRVLFKIFYWLVPKFLDSEINTSNGRSHEGCDKSHGANEQADESACLTEDNAGVWDAKWEDGDG